MNKRERREQVMSQRYAKVDQRKQVSNQAKAQQVKHDAMIAALKSSDHPLAKQYVELDAAYRATPNTRTDDHRQMDVITKWRQASPEQAKAMAEFLQDFETKFMEEAE